MDCGCNNISKCSSPSVPAIEVFLKSVCSRLCCCLFVFLLALRNSKYLKAKCSYLFVIVLGPSALFLCQDFKLVSSCLCTTRHAYQPHHQYAHVPRAQTIFETFRLVIFVLEEPHLFLAMFGIGLHVCAQQWEHDFSCGEMCPQTGHRFFQRSAALTFTGQALS